MKKKARKKRREEKKIGEASDSLCVYATLRTISLIFMAIHDYLCWLLGVYSRETVWQLLCFFAFMRDFFEVLFLLQSPIASWVRVSFERNECAHRCGIYCVCVCVCRLNELDMWSAFRICCWLCDVAEFLFFCFLGDFASHFGFRLDWDKWCGVSLVRKGDFHYLLVGSCQSGI